MAQGKVGSLYFTLGVNASDFEKKLNTATAKIADFGKNAERVGRSLSMSLTLPLSLLGGAAAKTAMDFETSMAKIEGLVGVAGDEVRAMGDEARKMAVQMGKSGNEAAEALFFITSAGLRGKEAMDVLAASMKASVAGLGETKVVADLATSAVNAYGSANIGAVEATDVMVAAVREGKLETQELAGSMGRVLPLASAMGVSFNEVGAAFAALSRTGTNASEAATQIRGILSSLLNPSGQAADELERLGLSGEMIRQVIKEDGLLAALELLKEKFEGNEEAAALVFGNIRALSGVLDLLGANVDTTREIFANMNDVAGDTQAAFDVMAQTAQFKLNTAIASAKDGLIDLGNAVMTTLLPVIERISNAINSLSTWFNGLSPEVQSLVVGFGALAAAAGPVLIVVGKLLQMAPMMSAAFSFLAGGPLGLLIVALGAAAAAYVLFTTKAKAVQAIGESTRPTIDKLTTTYENLEAAISDVQDAKTGVIKKTPEELAALKAIATAKYQEAQATLEQAQAERELLKAKINGMITDAVAGGKSAFGMEVIGYKQDLKDLDKTIADTADVKAKLAIQMDELGIAFENLGKQAGGAGGPVGELKDTLGELFTNVNKNDIFTKLADDIKGKFISAVEAGIHPLQRIDDILTSIAVKTTNPLEGMKDAVLSQLGPVQYGLESLFESMNKNPMEQWAADLDTFSQRMLQSVQGMAQGLGMALASNSGDFKSWALSVINTLLQAASAALLAGELIKLGPIGLVTALAGIGILQGIIAGISSGVNKEATAFATGGAVTGPTLALVGENPASRGEAIIPFERMGSFLQQFGMGGSGEQHITISGQLAGDTIRLSGQSASNKISSVRWGR